MIGRVSTPEQPDPQQRRQRNRAIAAAVAAVVAVVFALVNLDRVRVDWIVSSSRTPLIVVIAVSFALGLGAGLLIEKRRV